MGGKGNAQARSQLRVPRSGATRSLLIKKRFLGSVLVQLGRYLLFFRVRRQTTPHKLLRDSRHALAEVFGDPKIGFGWRNVRPLIGVRLCRSTEPEA